MFGRLWGTDSNNKVWTRHKNDADWVEITGAALTQVTVGTDGRIWGVNADGKLYTRT